MIYPCLCGHEKGDHQTRIGQRGNYTPCCKSGCKCDGFRAQPKGSARSNSSHFALRQGNRRGEWATACGRSVRERSLNTVEFAEWISCIECRNAAIAAKAALAGDAPDAEGQ